MAQYGYRPWTQPVLTADGTVGGSSFACEYRDHSWESLRAYLALDGNNSTFAQWRNVGSSFVIYNPTELNVSAVYMKWYATNAMPQSASFDGSNDGSSWTTLATFTNTSAEFTLDLSANKKDFKYYRIYTLVAGTADTHWNDLYTITLTAKERYEIPPRLLKGRGKTYCNVDKTTQYITSVFSSSTPQTTSINLESGLYLIEMYGAGGGATHYARDSAHGNSLDGTSGSGAGFKAILTLQEGSYGITIGAGGKYASADRSVQAGSGGSTTFSGSGSTLVTCGGAVGALPSGSSNIGGVLSYSENLNITKIFKGNTGNGNKGNVGGGREYYSVDLSGGASLADGTTTGYGAGGSTTYDYKMDDRWNGKNGYFSIAKVYSEKPETYDYKLTEKKYNTIKETEREYYKTVFESSSVGSYQINIDDGTYRVIAVGAGGAGAKTGYEKVYRAGGGGSGALFNGHVLLPSGTYSISVGAGGTESYKDNYSVGADGGSTTFSSASETLITCGGGLGGYAKYTDYNGGAGGTANTSENTNIVKTTSLTGGNQGGKGTASSNNFSVYGGASNYQQYGKGGDTLLSNWTKSVGGDGYIKVEKVFTSEPTEYDNYEDITTYKVINL